MTKDTNAITDSSQQTNEWQALCINITGMQNEATEQEQTNGNQIDETLNC